MGYLNDEWTLSIDDLGAGGFALELQKLILEVQPPFCFSIGGRWGGGKTSMLQALKASMTVAPPSSDMIGEIPTGLGCLKESHELSHIKTVWFSPWQYQHEENPLVPLLHEIREQIRYQWMHIGLKNAADVIDAALNSFGSLIDSAINFGVKSEVVSVGRTFMTRLRERKDERNQQMFNNKLDSQRFVKQFDDAVRKAIAPQLPENTQEPGGGIKERLIIFIDDLDRCSDQTVYALLESIKLTSVRLFEKRLPITCYI
uniref:KAP P-loop domain protein n=1 Tax=Magnetococcus massalia (strain MO-1) TaxID=451514 RepID=A0A1S7LR67_MAGMO